MNGVDILFGMIGVAIFSCILFVGYLFTEGDEDE